MRAATITLRAVLLLTAIGVSPAAQTCGYHDPSSMRVGMLNLAYPDALYVRTAVWSAQLSGAIARDEVLPETDPQTATIRAMFRLRATVVRLGELGDRMGASLDGRPVPAFSMVLIGTMLWTRFEPAGAALRTEVHTTGPAPGDVVIVTDEPVVAALLDGRISARDARELGLVRFYGAEAGVQDVASLLDRLPADLANSAAMNAARSIEGDERHARNGNP
jgi:hypothetical protein